MKEKRIMINSYSVKNGAKKWLIRIGLILILFGLMYLFLFPIFYLISTAFQSEESLNDPSVVWLPTSFSLNSFKQTMKLLNYKNSVILTSEITVLSTAATIATCSMAGYGLARYKFRGSGICFALVILMIIIPPQATLLSSYLNFRFFDFFGIMRLFESATGFGSVNLLDTIWTFVLPACFANGLRAGLFIFIFRQFFLGMPKELEEAARIDGCNAFTTFLRIMIPMAKSAIITVVLFSVVWHWNDYYSSSMYFVGDVQPITPMLSSLKTILIQEGMTVSHTLSQFDIRVYLASGSLLALLPPLILYIFLQRLFTQSIEKTGIVG